MSALGQPRAVGPLRDQREYIGTLHRDLQSCGSSRRDPVPLEPPRTLRGGLGLSKIIRRRLPRTMPPALRELARAIRAGDGAVTVGLPVAETALIVAPHPDDETVLAGGTAAALAAEGCRVHVVVATDGEATRGSTLSDARIREARRREVAAACRVLGAEEPTLLGHPDGGLEGLREGLTTDLDEVLGRIRPQVVFVPWWLDGHPDHRAVCRSLADAEIGGMEIWCGEVWTALVPNRIVDYTAFADVKESALGEHHTAAEAIDLSAFLGRDRFRSLAGLRGVGTAEAFVVLDAAGFRAEVAAAHG